MKEKNKKLSIIIFLIMIIALPLTQYISYALTGDDKLDYRAYPSLVIFVFLISLFRSKLSIYLALIFVLYSTLFSIDTISSQASYMIQFVLTVLILYHLPSVTFNKFKPKVIDVFMIFSCYLFIVAYFLSANLNLRTNRVYYEGFIIAHAFAYFMAIFVYYFFQRNLFLFAILPFGFAIFSGTRTGVIMVVLTTLSYLFTLMKSHNYKKLVFNITIGILILLTIYTTNDLIRNQVNEYFQSFEGFSYSLSDNGRDSSEFTSGRSLFTLIGLKQISDNSYTLPNIIGRGPRSSYVYIKKVLGIEVWFHNDFLEILFSLGILNLILYLYAIYRYFKKTKDFFFLLFILVAGYINGFFLYSSISIIMIHYLSIYSKLHENITNKQPSL